MSISRHGIHVRAAVQRLGEKNPGSYSKSDNSIKVNTAIKKML